MRKITEIYDFLNTFCPVETQLSFDNAGFVLGDINNTVSTVILSLDVTSEVINEASECGAGLIVSHHPVIWNSTKRLLASDPDHRKYMSLIKNDISVISMHTNLDMAPGGVNDVLLELLGAEYSGLLDSEGVGRVGVLKAGQTPLDSFLAHCKKVLNTNGLRYYDAGRSVYRIGVVGGAGGSEIDDAFDKGCDTYVTADIKYDIFLRARELGINLIDADHFCTENPVMHTLCRLLKERFPDVDFRVSTVHEQTARFY